jgi:hypothetical protein
MTVDARRVASGRLALAMALATIPLAPWAAAQENAPVALAIEMRDLARMPLAVLRDTKSEVGRTFLASGVRVVWTDPAASPAEATTLKVFVVGSEASVSRGAEETGATLVGLAPHSGNWVQVFYGRVAAAVARRPVSVSVVLAHVIVHELGHLLLPPDSHASFGIMRRAVDLEQPSLRRFTDAQSRLIRAAVTDGRRYASRCGD